MLIKFKIVLFDNFLFKILQKNWFSDFILIKYFSVILGFFGSGPVLYFADYYVGIEIVFQRFILIIDN